MTRGKVEVEFAGWGGPAGEAVSRPPRRPRPPLRRLGLVAAAAVAVGSVVQVADERTQAAWLETVPGVVRPVDENLGVLWEVDRAVASGLLDGPVVGGVIVTPVNRFVSAVATPDPEAAGVDPATGRRLWTASLSEGGPGSWLPGRCRAAGEVAVCSSSRLARYSLDVSAVRLVVLDPADGRAVRAFDVAVGTAWTTVGGAVVLGEEVARSGSGSSLSVTWRLRAQDAVSGDAAWEWTTPQVPAGGGAGSAGERSALDEVAGTAWLVAGERLFVVAAGGALEREVPLGADDRAFPTRTGSLVVSHGAASELAAGDGWVPVPGRPLELQVDDGSSAELVFLEDGALVAVDGTGAQVWRAQVPAAGAVLLKGRLYVATGSAVAAFDARTGAALWTARPAAGASAVTTDGAQLLVGGAGSTLTAVGFDGNERWSVALGDLVWADGAVRYGTSVVFGLAAPRVGVQTGDGRVVVVG